MNTSKIGSISELAVITKYLELGYIVSLPFLYPAPYDCIIDSSSGLLKVQIKTGRLSKGCLIFQATKGYRSKEGFRKYQEGETDVFAVYEPISKKVYHIPFTESLAYNPCLRVEPTKNNQEKGIKWARDYEI